MEGRAICKRRDALPELPHAAKGRRDSCTEDQKSSVKFINDHNIQGGRSIDQVKKAIKVEVKDIKRYPDKMRVSVDVTNAGSGHMIPTGTPSRKMVLDVTVKTATGQMLKDQRVYKKKLIGAGGMEFTKDSDAMCNRSTIASDNRIAPRETRREEFIFISRRMYRLL